MTDFKAPKMRIMNYLLFLFFSLGSTCWGAGEYLSEGDKAFLKKLDEKFLVESKLGVTAKITINEQQFHINKGVLANASEFFLDFFMNAQVEVAKNEYILKDHNEDVFTKVLRYIYHHEYEPFNPKQDESLRLTKELLKEIDYFKIKNFGIIVLGKVKISDQKSLVGAIDLLDQKGSPLDQIEASKLIQSCRDYCRKTSYGTIHADSLYKLIGKDYFQERFPGFVKILDEPDFRPFTFSNKEYVLIHNPENGSYLPARISEKRNGSIFVHYVGWPTNSDAWVYFDRTIPKSISTETEFLEILNSTPHDYNGETQKLKSELQSFINSNQ